MLCCPKRLTSEFSLSQPIQCRRAERKFNFNVWQATSTFSTNVQSYFPFSVAEGNIFKRFEKKSSACWMATNIIPPCMLCWLKPCFQWHCWRPCTTIIPRFIFQPPETQCDACVPCRANCVISQQQIQIDERRIKWKIKKIENLSAKISFLRFALNIVCIIFSFHGLRWDMCVRFYSLFTRFNFLLCLCVETWRWRKTFSSFPSLVCVCRESNKWGL